jgi:hypothetical protein
MMKKQTAMEWLVERLAENGILHSSDINQAKQMEKEQMEDSFDVGYINAFDDYHKMQNGEAFTTITFEQYYNETYSK